MKGFDILIVTASDQQNVEFWEKRLSSLPGTKIVVHEDWPDGAGNGLGTLYACQQAQKKGNIDLFKTLHEGASVAIYHTAGKGIRLYPLTPSEGNNFSALKLPGIIGKAPELLTLLEAAILQTSHYAASRKGRLSVFWGDQLFVPTQNLTYTPTHHIDILVKGDDVSLGPFSLSKEVLFALMREFEYELSRKEGALHSHFHFWMPMMLDKKSYFKFAKERSSHLDLNSHYYRMRDFRDRFCYRYALEEFFGVLDIGKNAFWWDLGSVNRYYTHLMKLTGQSLEGRIMRMLLSATVCKNESRVVHDDNSLLIGCNISSGYVKNSILLGVTAESLEVSNSIIVNSQVYSLKSDGCLLYNVQETEKLSLKKGTVRADTKTVKLYTQLHRDAFHDWNIQLKDNALSYGELEMIKK